MGYKELTPDEHVYLTTSPKVNSLGQTIWSERFNIGKTKYLYDSDLEFYFVGHGLNREIVAIVLFIFKRRIRSEKEEPIVSKSYKLYTSEDFAGNVEEFVEWLDKEIEKQITQEITKEVKKWASERITSLLAKGDD
jgi:hypothetical protein